ncbi:ATP-binding protein [Flavobacterium sp. N502540]|uniref:ATP-binding protein n=1 Tax=Flavobacterium sp. N502540 TaxID=2986838 RepID=UPI0022258072|nr:ATP-binding protein [Flavobacterium sp. N502540]
MTLKELKEIIAQTITCIKDHGIFPKENDHFDYKEELNFYGLSDPTEIFARNFAKDILSFSNSEGGIIILGIKEDKQKGAYDEVGLNEKNIDLLNKVDLNLITQKFEKIAKIGVSIDLQSFQLGTRKFFYILIEKQNQILIPINNFTDYKISKGDIIYRVSSKNETANSSTQDFNRFLQMKANEKNKEFMEIWSKLLPEMFEINPREILIINPKFNKIYGYNGQDNTLSSSEIEIDKSNQGIFNVILQAISAGEIGRISDNEGKPLYRIVGEVRTASVREHISLSTLLAEVLKKSEYKISSVQLKVLLKYLNWVTEENFKVENPPSDPTTEKFREYIWLENFDKIKNAHKVVFAEKAIPIIIEVLNDNSKHEEIFGKSLIRHNIQPQNCK